MNWLAIVMWIAAACSVMNACACFFMLERRELLGGLGWVAAACAQTSLAIRAML